MSENLTNFTQVILESITSDGHFGVLAPPNPKVRYDESPRVLQSRSEYD